MKSNVLASKFYLLLKISLGALLFGTAINVYAEYYVVYPVVPVNYSPEVYENYCGSYTCGYRTPDCGGCSRCCHRHYYRTYTYTYTVPVYYIYSSAPRRHQPSMGSEEVATYAWIPTPEAP